MALPQREEHYTYADLLTWDDETRYELYDGWPVALASPSSRHQLIAFALTGEFYQFLRGRTCKAYPAPFDVRLFAEPGDAPEDTDTVVEPDLIVVCDPEKIDRQGCKGAPDLVVEILSPATRKRDLGEKYFLYERAGVREYWVVDPARRVLQVYPLVEGRYAAAELYGPGDTVPSSLWEEFALDLSAVFPADDPFYERAE